MFRKSKDPADTTPDPDCKPANVVNVVGFVHGTVSILDTIMCSYNRCFLLGLRTRSPRPRGLVVQWRPVSNGCKGGPKKRQRPEAETGEVASTASTAPTPPRAATAASPLHQTGVFKGGLSRVTTSIRRGPLRLTLFQTSTTAAAVACTAAAFSAIAATAAFATANAPAAAAPNAAAACNSVFLIFLGQEDRHNFANIEIQAKLSWAKLNIVELDNAAY